MNDKPYDITIGDVAKILDKSDRQVRRYVKEHRLKANPVRVDGHVKLMFSKQEVEAFKTKLSPERPLQDETLGDVVMEAVLVDESDVNASTSGTDDIIGITPDVDTGVKYVVDALKEQLDALRQENRDLHYQLEQRSGQVGFLQAKIETLQEEVKALAPAVKEQVADIRPWYKRLFRVQEAAN